MHIAIPQNFGQENALSLKNLLSSNPGNYQVFLVVNGKKAQTKILINPGEKTIKNIENIVGQNKVKML